MDGHFEAMHARKRALVLARTWDLSSGEKTDAGQVFVTWQELPLQLPIPPDHMVAA